MRRTWLISAGIAVVGLLAGVGIAGRPLASDSFIIGAAATDGSAATDVVTSTAVSADSSSTSTSAVPPTTVSNSVAPTTVAPSTSQAPDPTAAPTTGAPTSAPTTIATTTTTTTPPPPPPPPIDQTLDRADVRLVVANGDGRFNLAGANGNRLKKAGYVTIDLADVPTGSDPTVLYYRPGFDDEAAIVAADLLVPGALLQPLPDTPITVNDELGDIIVVLGPDALR